MRGHRSGLKRGQKSKGAPGAHFPNQKRACATSGLSVERYPVFLELVAGRQAQAQAPPARYSPPFIHPSPVGLAWLKSECLAGSAISLRCSAPTRPHTSCSMATPACVSHAVEGQWLEWGPWGPCSTSCANGTQQRSRKCSVAGPAWATCTGALTDTRECSNLECPGECSAHGWQVAALALGALGAAHAPLLLQPQMASGGRGTRGACAPRRVTRAGSAASACARPRVRRATPARALERR